MSNKNFKTLHYDGTVSMHGDIKTAMAEATQRLEPWRDNGDRVVRQLNETEGSKLSRILVVNPVNEPTDAASYISPCGDWINARKCLPNVNQRILVFWRWKPKPDQNETGFFDVDVFDSEHIADSIKDGSAPDCIWWRPIPAPPVESEGATQC